MNYRRSRRGGNTGVQRVHIKAQVNRTVTAWIDVIEGHFDHFANAPLVDMVHAERLDVMLDQNGLFGSVNVSQTNVYQSRGIQDGLEPVKDRDRLTYAHEEGVGHAMDVARVCRLERVDVGVGVDPDDTCVGVVAGINRLTDRFQESLTQFCEIHGV